MSNCKIVFIDRDGTLIDEPADKQVDSIDKLRLEPNVIPALLKLIESGFTLVMVSNQDGLGTDSLSQQEFDLPHQKLLDIFNSQGISFEAIKICPHFDSENCDCRKPRVGLLLDYLKNNRMDFSNSYVIGDRDTDLQLADNMGVKGILYGPEKGWLQIANEIISKPRSSEVRRVTNETNISAQVNLDAQDVIDIDTGIGFFDHMLEQLAKHGGFSLTLKVKGDLHIDEHHTVEDTALCLGEALRNALGDKLGISRYGFTLPMDEALSQVAIDLSGRPYLVFEGKFERENVGELPTELIPHFFRSLSETLGAAINIKLSGENSHHMIESVFKAMGRALRFAIKKQGKELPSTKGVL